MHDTYDILLLLEKNNDILKETKTKSLHLVSMLYNLKNHTAFGSTPSRRCSLVTQLPTLVIE